MNKVMLVADQISKMVLPAIPTLWTTRVSRPHFHGQMWTNLCVWSVKGHGPVYLPLWRDARFCTLVSNLGGACRVGAFQPTDAVPPRSRIPRLGAGTRNVACTNGWYHRLSPLFQATFLLAVNRERHRVGRRPVPLSGRQTQRESLTGRQTGGN